MMETVEVLWDENPLYIRLRVTELSGFGHVVRIKRVLIPQLIADLTKHQESQCNQEICSVSEK